LFYIKSGAPLKQSKESKSRIDVYTSHTFSIKIHFFSHFASKFVQLAGEQRVNMAKSGGRLGLMK